VNAAVLAENLRTFATCMRAHTNGAITDVKFRPPSPRQALPVVSELLRVLPFLCCLLLAIMSKYDVIHKTGST